MTASILVTGGAGYIGAHTVRALRAAERPVVVLDSLELSTADSVIDADLVIGNIADDDLVEQICRDYSVDTIVHFAGYKRVGESMEQPAKYFQNNVDATAHMLDGAVRAGVDQIVFSSSCSVYGTPVHSAVDETEAIAPESVYAETKAMAERVLHWYGIVHGLRSVSLRYFNAAGASFDGRIGEDWSFAVNLIPAALKALLTDAPPLQVYGNDYPTADGTCIRDYIHVDDLAGAHLAAVNYLAAGGESTAVNVGTGVGASVTDVLQGIERVAGRPVPHVLAPRRAGDPVASYSDTTRSQQVLGWTAHHGLDEILETAYRWHSQQLDADG